MKILGKDRSFPQLVAALSYYARIAVAGFKSVVPQLVFGNSAGFKNNILPRVELYRLQHTYGGTPADSQSIACARTLKRSGVCIFRQQNDTVSLERIKEKLKRIYDDRQYYIDSPNKTQQRIVDPLALLPELNTLFPDAIANTIIEYYGCAFKIQSVHAWRNLGVACGEREGNRFDYMSNTLHNDYWPVTSLRVFTILSDNVTKRTGAFRYHDKRSTKALIRSFNYFHRFLLPPNSFRKLYNPDGLHYFEGHLGDACLVNTQEVLHGSSVPEEHSFRDVVQFLIVPAAGSPVRGRGLFENLPEDQEMLKLLEEAGRSARS